MIPENDSDKRRYIRYELLEYALAYLPNSGEPRNVVIVNIGLGGLQLRSRDTLPVGETCQLHVGMVDRPPVVLPAVIKHSMPIPGSDLIATGLRFTPRNHDEKLTIAEFVHSVFQRQCDLLSS